MAIANYFVLEELNRFPAVLARNIEDCIGAPLVCVIACAFPHNPFPLQRDRHLSTKIKKPIAKAA
jgi:hypothetical protein